MKYIIFISLLLSIFNNCQQKKQKKFSDKNLLILAILDSEYCKDPRVVYITASSSAVKDYNGVKYIDLYKSNSFVFRNTLDTSDVSRISFQFDLSMKKNPYVSSYSLFWSSDQPTYCRTKLNLSDGSTQEFRGLIYDPFNFTAGDYRFVPVR